MAITFMLASVLWVFFRAETISDAVYVIKHMFTGWDAAATFQEMQAILYTDIFSSGTLLIYMGCAIVFSVGIIWLFDICREREDMLLFDKFKTLPRWGIYVVISMAVVFHWLLLNGVYGQTGAFIYFQF